MNLPTFERALLADFAYQQARYTGNLECMRAICFVLRNRVRSGWNNSSWIAVIGTAAEAMGDYQSKRILFDTNDRLLQMIIRDVDDIYMGQDRHDDSTRQIAMGDSPTKTAALYFMFVDRPANPVFAEKIVRSPADHPQIGNIGPLMLYR